MFLSIFVCLPTVVFFLQGITENGAGWLISLAASASTSPVPVAGEPGGGHLLPTIGGIGPSGCHCKFSSASATAVALLQWHGTGTLALA